MAQPEPQTLDTIRARFARWQSGDETFDADIWQAFADIAALLADLDAAREELRRVEGERDEATAQARTMAAAADRFQRKLVEIGDELAGLRKERVVSVIFSHHKDAPRPFALYRRQDVSGISGIGVVAEGAAFSDGTAVLRWLSDWPTSVVFHDRGIEAIEAVHGHGGATQVVWLSEEPEPLAEMEQQRDVAVAERDRMRPLLQRAEVYLGIEHQIQQLHDHLGTDLGCAGCKLLSDIRAVDTYEKTQESSE